MTPQETELAYTRVAVRDGTTPGIRYTSGRIVYDEALLDGHWIGRYWSPSGQV